MNHRKMVRDLERLKNALAEKRSDIAEILEHIIEGTPWSVKQIERRLVYCKVPPGADKAEYDTLTTEISFRVPAENRWTTGEKHEYK